MSLHKEVALVEWLTRCPAILPGNPFGGVGSNPAGDANKFFFILFFLLTKIFAKYRGSVAPRKCGFSFSWHCIVTPPNYTATFRSFPCLRPFIFTILSSSDIPRVE